MGHLIKILSLFWVLSIVGCLDLKKSDQSPVGIQGNGAGYGGGNGAGYGGGDNALTNARLLLVRSLIQFKDGVSQDDIANAEACLAQVRTPSLCNLLVGLAPTQKTFIVNFLKAHVQTLLDMNLGSNKVLFEFTNEFLGLSQSDGFTRDLAAKTKLGRSGNILFNTDAVQVMSDWERFQLITHELGHKLENISSDQKYVDDDSIIGPFSSGKIFLDTLGSALVGYLASGIGKTIVAFPTDKTCDSHTTGQLLASAPYYANKSQEALGLLPRIQTVSDSGTDFTLTAWIRVFDDLQESDSRYLGQVIFSNKDLNKILIEINFSLKINSKLIFSKDNINLSSIDLINKEMVTASSQYKNLANSYLKRHGLKKDSLINIIIHLSYQDTESNQYIH